MENRDRIVTEYFELIVLLNKANPKINQRTEIDFRIERKSFNTLRLVIFLQGIDPAGFLEICHKTGVRSWEPSGVTGFLHFEEYCVSFIKKRSSNNITFPEMRSIVGELKSELRNLGILR